jgi:hypothetical protein
MQNPNLITRNIAEFYEEFSNHLNFYLHRMILTTTLLKSITTSRCFLKYEI